MPAVFIGMPVYNGERYIGKAVECLLNQTFSDWKLLISDNASEDTTPLLCKEYANKDKRISYIRHQTNTGILNFRYLLEMNRSKYFMWAAHDDEWDSHFIESCLTNLESSEDIGIAFTNIANIDSFGRIIREYPSFTKYCHSDRYVRIINFVLDPECFGKANLIYGIYRAEKLKDFILDFFSKDAVNCHASDAALVLGILCRTRLSIDERVLFRKRIATQEDRETVINYHKYPNNPVLESVELDNFQAYEKACLAASAGTEYGELVSVLMDYRKRQLKAMQDYISRVTNGNPLKSILKTALPDSVVRFIRKHKK